MSDVFISYSRRDTSFVRRLSDALNTSHYHTWVDWQDIPPTAKFMEEIYSGIEDTSAFIFVLSPDSITSKVCLLELEHAEKYHKKILPLVSRPVASTAVKPSLRELNWISFCETDTFDTAFQALLLALETDLDYQRQAAQWLKRAVLWTSKHQDQSILLRGKELRDAERWLSEGAKKQPHPTPLHTEFIHASRSTTRKRFILWSILLILFLVTSTIGVTLVQRWSTSPPTLVTTLNDSGPGSFREAIISAAPGDVITFDPRLRGTIILTNDDVKIAKNLTIRGPNTGAITLSSGPIYHLITILQGFSVTISGLTLRGGKFSLVVVNKGKLSFSNNRCINSELSNDGSATLLNNVFSGDAAGGDVAIANSGDMLIKNTLSSNTHGGVVNYAHSKIDIVDSTISNSQFGGIANYGVMTLTNSVVSDNTAFSVAGIDNGSDGTLILINSTVSGNRTFEKEIPPFDNSAGGIDSSGNLILLDSTVSQNTSAMGGGIYVRGGNFALINSTISDNAATYSGGGIELRASSPGTILFSTVYNNKAGTGGGIAIDVQRVIDQHNRNPPSQLIARNSLIAGNEASSSPDISGTLITEGYNLIQNPSGTLFVDQFKKHATDRVGSQFMDVGIDATLRNNGGRTQTHALLAGSPALDAIPPDACHVSLYGITTTTDQRGMKRPGEHDDRCDIGAYEHQV
jgi:TIR domain/Right handed beta helix region